MCLEGSTGKTLHVPSGDPVVDVLHKGHSSYADKAGLRVRDSSAEDAIAGIDPGGNTSYARESGGAGLSVQAGMKRKIISSPRPHSGPDPL